MRQDTGNDLPSSHKTLHGEGQKSEGFKSEHCYTGETMLALDLEMFHLQNQDNKKFQDKKKSTWGSF